MILVSVGIKWEIRIYCYDTSHALSPTQHLSSRPCANQASGPSTWRSVRGHAGPLNAITDVPGVEVGHRSLISGESVRTGVTAVWPRGKASNDPVFGGFFSQNGNGDMTGTHWLEESGFLDGPVLITNTHSVGVVRDAYLAWLVKNKRKPGTNVFAGGFYTYPIVAETYDGFLNDINGFHVKPDDVTAALDRRRRAPWPKATSAAAPAWSATASRVASARRRANSRRPRRIHRRRAGAVQLRKPQPVAHRRTAGGRGDGRQSARRQPGPSVSGRHGLHHHRGGDRRAAAAAPDQAAGPPRHHGAGAHRRHLGQRIGRYLHRLLHRQSAAPPRRRRRQRRHAAQRSPESRSSKPRCRPPKKPSSTP